MDARLREAEDEMARLRGEVRQLRTEASIEKKQKEDLQCAYRKKKKNGIKRDVPSIPPGEEKKLLDKPAP
ncbi:hypothetical protein AAG906_034364 [Vitis piasezkii]